jgi:membrane protease YdiL (CAAX protease family)
MEQSTWLSTFSILILSVILALTSLKRSPGVGVLGAIVVIAFVTWQRGEGLESLGFVRPESWLNTILLSLFLGAILALASTMVIEPLTDKLTGETHDHSLFDGIRGDFGVLLKWLLVVWVLVAFLEEIIFRGFLMNELARLLGTGVWGTIINLTFSSILFGMAHWYQGKSGALSTGLVGLLIGLIFVGGGYNLWLPILIHGFIDTFGLVLVYLNADQQLKRVVRSKKAESD